MKAIHVVMGVGVTLIIAVGAWYFHMANKAGYAEAKQRGLPGFQAADAPSSGADETTPAKAPSEAVTKPVAKPAMPTSAPTVPAAPQ